MSELIQRISQVTEEVRQGTRTSNREKDVLSQALGIKERPGRTRGIGIVPWKLAFPQESNTYQSRSRGRADQEVEYLRQLKEMEDRMDTRIEATVEARVQQILLSKGSGVPQNPTPTVFSPQFRVATAVDRPRSTKKMRMCLIRWTSLNPVDGITESRQVS